MWRGAMQPAMHDDLMARVLDSENMRRAWKRVKANKGVPGIDGMHIEDFAEFACSSWPEIRQALCDGSYQPQPVRRVSIPKPNGGVLALGTSKWQAIRTGLSSKAYWHLARTLATQTGMTNDWLKSQGLLSVRDL